jgi:drug/metabolite transporter (DMT)-like permease
MADKPESGKIHELAGGWITERAGTPIPTFLKFTYVGFCLFGLWYLFTYWAGETTHATRGTLVQEANRIMQVPGMGLHAVIGVILLAFVVGLLVFAFSSREDGE